MQDNGSPIKPEPMLTASKVAAMIGVNPKTVTRWAKAGQLRCIKTPGGHRRYRESDIQALLNGDAR